MDTNKLRDSCPDTIGNSQFTKKMLQLMKFDIAPDTCVLLYLYSSITAIS